MSTVALSVLCVLLLAALVYRESQHSRHIFDREKGWDLERGTLLTRVQHPEVIIPPAPRREEDVIYEPIPGEPDESFLVGTIQTGAPDA